MILATYIKLANEKNIELLKATIPKSTLNPVDGHSPRRVLEDSMKKSEHKKRTKKIFLFLSIIVCVLNRNLRKREKKHKKKG